MPVRTLLRIAPAVWLSPFVLAMGWLFANQFPRYDPYSPALTAAAASAIAFVAPLCAACAAWEGARLRRAHWFTLPHVRATGLIVLRAMSPVLLVGCSSLALLTIYAVMTASVVFVPDARIMVSTLIILVAHVLFGFTLGIRVPTIIAVPATFLVSYFWLGFPVSLIDPPWLRHLTGLWFFCCGTSTDLAPQTIIGALAVALGLIGTACLLLRQSITLLTIVLVPVPLLIGLTVGISLVREFSFDALVARDPALLVCAGENPRVCVWPEHQTRLEEVVQLATHASAAWREMGVFVPSEFVESYEPQPGMRSFGFSIQTDSATLLNALAYTILPPFPACAEHGGEYLGYAAEDYILAWLNVTAGATDAQLVTRFDEDELRAVALVRAQPRAQQQAWLERNLLAIEQCGIPPQPEPIS